MKVQEGRARSAELEAVSWEGARGREPAKKGEKIKK